MTQRLDAVTARDHALIYLEQFCTRIMPGMVYRILTWKGLPKAYYQELRAELRQELAVDCLENAPQVIVQPRTVRHSRWMRIAERYVYQHLIKFPRRHRQLAEWSDRGALCIVQEPSTLPPVQAMRNGRMNLMGTAAQRGVNLRGMRRQVDFWAHRLGRGDEHHAFWRMRLAEALTGLGADLLRDRNQVLLLPRPRTMPDPKRRLQRLRRLVGRFSVCPATRLERSVLRHWLRQRGLDWQAPRRLLQSAVALAPFQHAPWLWLFEACLVEGDAAGATQALRECRRRAAPTLTASTLARARLLEARGRMGRARALLRRAAARWPRDRTLARVSHQLDQSQSAQPGW